MTAEPMRVHITRKWPLERPYEMYIITVDVPCLGDRPEDVLKAARYAASRCHEAWGEYNAEYKLLRKAGGDFETAKAVHDTVESLAEDVHTAKEAVEDNQARRQEPEQPGSDKSGSTLSQQSSLTDTAALAGNLRVVIQSEGTFPLKDDLKDFKLMWDPDEKIWHGTFSVQEARAIQQYCEKKKLSCVLADA